MIVLAGLFVLTMSVMGRFLWRQKEHKMPVVPNSSYVPLTSFNDSRAVAPALSLMGACSTLFASGLSAIRPSRGRSMSSYCQAANQSSSQTTSS